MYDEPISKQLFGKLRKGLYTFLIIWLCCFFLDKCINPDIESSGKPYWTNLEPGRSVQEIASYDYENMTVEYRDNRPYQGKLKSRSYSYPSNGITIKSGNTVIKTDVTPEELLEQLDLDFHDIGDYYGIELR